MTITRWTAALLLLCSATAALAEEPPTPEPRKIEVVYLNKEVGGMSDQVYFESLGVDVRAYPGNFFEIVSGAPDDPHGRRGGKWTVRIPGCDWTFSFPVENARKITITTKMLSTRKAKAAYKAMHSIEARAEKMAKAKTAGEMRKDNERFNAIVYNRWFWRYKGQLYIAVQKQYKLTTVNWAWIKARGDKEGWAKE